MCRLLASIEPALVRPDDLNAETKFIEFKDASIEPALVRPDDKPNPPPVPARNRASIEPALVRPDDRSPANLRTCNNLNHGFREVQGKVAVSVRV